MGHWKDGHQYVKKTRHNSDFTNSQKLMKIWFQVVCLVQKQHCTWPQNSIPMVKHGGGSVMLFCGGTWRKCAEFCNKISCPTQFLFKDPCIYAIRLLLKFLTLLFPPKWSLCLFCLFVFCFLVELYRLKVTLKVEKVLLSLFYITKPWHSNRASVTGHRLLYRNDISIFKYFL